MTSDPTIEPQVFENAPDGIFIADRDGLYLDVNPAGCRLLGYRREELIGRSITEFVAPEELERQANLRRDLQAGRPEVSEWRLRRKDGSFVWTELSSNALADGRLQAFVRDITARHDAEEAARVSDERFAAIVSISSDAIIAVDEEQRILVFNRGAEQIFGYRREEVVGASLAILIPERFRDGHARHVGTFSAGTVAARQMGERGATIMGRRRSGEEFPAEAAISRTSAGGRPILTVSLRDITERQRSENALRSALERFEVALLGANAVVIEEDEQLRRSWIFDPKAPPDHGAATLGKTDQEILPAPDAERIVALKRQVLETGRPERTVLTATASDGAPRCFDIRIAPRHDAAGGIVGVVTAAWDITERQRSENEEHLLAEAGHILVAAGSDYEALLTEVARLIVGATADWCAVDLVHASGIRRLRVIHRDPALAAICEGLERFPVHRRENIVSGVVRNRETLLVSEVTPGYLEGLAQSPEHLQLLRDFDLSALVIAPLLARGQVLGTLAFGRSGPGRRYDTDDVRMAERLATLVALAVDNARLHTDLARAVRARDEVLGIVAHDLRNPLGAIGLAAQTIAHQLSEQRAERGTNSVELIRRSVRRANRLIDDLLDVTRMDAGELHVTFHHCPARLLVLDAVESQQLLAAAATIELSFDVPPDLPAVWVDRDRCLQVLENLIGNAIKFTPPGGRIVVTAAPAGAAVRFAVADSGPGIAVEQRARVFDRFWQGEHAKGRGAGLGLQICRGIVTAHGGRIWIEGTPGGGATFAFTLPISHATAAELAPVPPAATPAPAPAAPGGAGRIILVVEDEDAARVALAELLRDLGYRVLVASGPAEALQLSAASDTPVDLLLTDLRLPEMRGDQLAARLRASRPQLKVIFMSGDAGASPAGTAFLPKPIDLDALAEAITYALT